MNACYLRNGKNNNSKRGALLIRQFHKIELTVNERSKADALHAQNILEMRDVKSPVDILKNESFANAVIAVAGNDEGNAVNTIRGEAFALRNGRPIIQWRKKPSNPTALHNNENFLKIYGYFPSATATFIEGAPSFLHRNLNVSLGLANRTRSQLHSLILNPKTAQTDAALIAACEPGAIVVITEPIAVNVLIPNVKRASWPVGASITDDEKNVIIPITPAGNDRKNTKIRVSKTATIFFKNFP
jgi:hypothetical protein